MLTNLTYFARLTPVSLGSSLTFSCALQLGPIAVFFPLRSAYIFSPRLFSVHVNFRYFPALYSSHRWPSFFFLALCVHIFPRFFPVHVISDLDDVTEIRKFTANVEAVLLGVLIPLCQRNSGRLDEADREVLCHFKIIFATKQVLTVCLRRDYHPWRPRGSQIQQYFLNKENEQTKQRWWAGELKGA